MIGDSELQFCKEYHLSQSKDLCDISNNLMWQLGKTLATHKKCIDKGYIVDGQVTSLVLANIRTVEEINITTIK